MYWCNRLRNTYARKVLYGIIVAMKTYIIFDLEWNQSPHGKEDSIETLPFEIIELGAVKLDWQGHQLGEFHRLIRPQVYTEMHFMISEVTHMNIKELNDHGEDFKTVITDFFQWCGEEAVYCTWGSQDLTELQRNLDYYGVMNPFPQPLLYYDVQKLYGLMYEGGRKLSLDAAVHNLGLLSGRPFHRALDDAWYTGQVLSKLDANRIAPYWSVDYYRIPADKQEEVYLTFPNYAKYVSRIFASKEAAMMDRSVTEMKCYLCQRSLRKKVRWFTPNQKIYYGLAVCPEHGYLKGKIRMKKVDETRIYVVRTLKLTSDDGAWEIRARKEDVRKKRSQRNRTKKQRPG